ncbi:MAG: transglutaminase domain-containing protein [Hespellia sp.]|nr:transglutaminase domain-containing protein [Hespellia sp.]
MQRRKRRGCFGKFIFVIFILAVLAMGIFYYVNPNGLAALVSRCQEMSGTKVGFEEITIAPEELEGKFYFHQLSEESQLVYQELLQGIQSSQAEIQLHSTDLEAIGEIYRKVLYDNPNLFWCDGSATTTGFSDYAVITPNYTCTPEEIETRRQEIDAAVQECLQGSPTEGTVYDKIKYVYEYLVNQTEYRLEASDSQNIYSVFVNKESVCAGYAKATQLLLQKQGIECIYVVGTTDTQESHTWNMVKIDEEYYHVDTTWGDPVFVMQEDQVQNVSNISYDYLCCSDEEASRTHIWDTGIGLPLCSSKEYNYYVRNQCYYESYDPEILLKAMNETIYAGGEQTIFKFANDEVYNQAKDAVLSDLASRAMQNLMAAYGLSSVSCGQMVDDAADKIVIYWNYGP